MFGAVPFALERHIFPFPAYGSKCKKRAEASNTTQGLLLDLPQNWLLRLWMAWTVQVQGEQPLCCHYFRVVTLRAKPVSGPPPAPSEHKRTRKRVTRCHRTRINLTDTSFGVGMEIWRQDVACRGGL